MSPEQRLKEIEDRLLKLDAERVSLLREIQNIRNQYSISAGKMSEILGFGTNSYRLYEGGEIPSVSNGRLILAVKDPGDFKKQKRYETITLQNVSIPNTCHCCYSSLVFYFPKYGKRHGYLCYNYYFLWCRCLLLSKSIQRFRKNEFKIRF